MSSIFTKIIKGELPCYKVAENEQFIAFLNIHPNAKGHTLVVPKQEIDYIFDLPPQLLSDFMLFSQKIATALKQTIPCLRVGVAVVGLEVPHAHIHLIPLNSMYDFNFTQKITLAPETMQEIAQNIAQKVTL